MPSNLEYFYGGEADQFTFFRIPKVLFPYNLALSVDRFVFPSMVPEDFLHCKAAVSPAFPQLSFQMVLIIGEKETEGVIIYGEKNDSSNAIQPYR